MIQVTPLMRILIGIEPVDFRCQIDGLAAVCRQVFSQDPKNGALFVFKNKARTALKILTYDGDSFWLCHRRLSKGHIKWWPKDVNGAKATTMDANELIVLLWNGNPSGVFGEPWKRLPTVERNGPKEHETIRGSD